MTDTWGIPGPLFTSLYLGLLVLPALFAVVRTGLLRRGRRRERRSGPKNSHC
jgi:hypothetical protein